MVTSMKGIYESERLRITMNPAGEIFVINKQDGDLALRISPERGRMVVTCAGGVLTPSALNGLSAFVAERAMLLPRQ